MYEEQQHTYKDIYILFYNLPPQIIHQNKKFTFYVLRLYFHSLIT